MQEFEYGPFVFIFPDVPFSPGELEARAYGGGGGANSSSEGSVASDVRVTTGEPAALRLTKHVSPAHTTPFADGADVVLVDVEVVDSEDRRVPTALNTIEFSLDQPSDDAAVMEWRGGLATPPNPDDDDEESREDNNYILSTTLPVEQGINRVILRTTTQAGTATLTARDAEGKLAEAEVKLETRELLPPSPLALAGLGTSLPGSDLPARLDRGPTPPMAEGETELAPPTRKALRVASASAGQDGEHAGMAVDGDEETMWSSEREEGGEGDDIRLTLLLEEEEEQEVQEVTVKLDGFRDQEHRVQVLIGRSGGGGEDGEGEGEAVVVFDGVAPRSLGYVTLVMEEVVRGRSVTLRSADGRDLGVVEVEVYGPVGGK